MTTNLPEHLRHALLKETKNAVAVYPYGSRVYGTAEDDSDWDFVVVTSKARKKSDMKRGLLNIKYWSPDHFQHLLDEHHITALECYFLPIDRGYSDTIVLPDKPWKFKLGKAKLYESLIEKADRDWAKAEKWLRAVDKTPENVLKAKKAIWHSFRILSFGCQIATLKTIFGYDEASWTYHLIMKASAEDWEYHETFWKPKYIDFKESFRKVTL